MLATSMGAIGGGLQIAAHAAGKMTLFMCAGAIYVAHHKTLVSELRGLGPKMPLTFILFFIGAMSIVGLPPAGGSWPKFLLMLGAADAGELLVIGVLILSSLLNVVYLLSIPIEAFHLLPAKAGEKPQGAGAAPIDWRRIEEAPLLCLLPPAMTALFALLLFLLADPLYRYLLPIAGG
jgi:multicomponent Na+:H+ antiporter subunit D